MFLLVLIWKSGFDAKWSREKFIWVTLDSVVLWDSAQSCLMASWALPWGRQADVQQECFKSSPLLLIHFPLGSPVLTYLQLHDWPWVCNLYFLLFKMPSKQLFTFSVSFCSISMSRSFRAFSVLNTPLWTSFHFLLSLASVHASPHSGKLGMIVSLGNECPFHPMWRAARRFEEFGARQCVFSAYVHWPDAIPAYAKGCIKLVSPWPWPGHHGAEALPSQ